MAGIHTALDDLDVRKLMLWNYVQDINISNSYYQEITWKWPYLFTYLLTPYSGVVREKLTGSQLVKKFLAFYGNRRFITAFISARYLSLS
jgi:hypothetical protein